MRKSNISCHLVFFIIIIFLFIGCGENSTAFQPIQGFDGDTNAKIEKFLRSTHDHKGRKVAVFDGDGTVFGQTPHYLADECLYEVAKNNPNQRPEVINKMKGMSNVSIPYVQQRVFFFEGKTLESVRSLGVACYEKYYKGRVYAPMQELIANLKRFGFEVWIVTASPEALYQKFLSKELGIPITNVIGVKSVIRHGKITREIIKPVPQDEGKPEAIESFVQAVPLFVAGNSRGDKEMIELSQGLKMIVNPDTHVAPDQEESVADYAKKEGWLVVRIKDVPPSGFPRISSKDFGIRLNKTNE